MATLVLLPGMDGTGDLFSPFIDALGDRVKTVVIRYPTDKALSYEALISFVRSALPPNEPYVLLGESFSGPIAISLAAEAPKHLRGIVLCCTFARSPRPALSPFTHLVAALPLNLAPSSALAWALLGVFSTPSLRAAITNAVRQVSSAVLRRRLLAVATVDVTGLLAQVHVPCLYLQATQDRLIPARAAAEITSANPRIAVVQIDAPHCMLQAAPAAAAQVVAPFFGQVVAAL
ncbi:alpha/beta fold hydrolase [Undibacterium sp. LX15W]|uniref:Alpha/beta fold hydrolase n=2 Tax=Undibacterium flavidum TaxID=2762297 RepID=A0ABR6YBP0_9BURK|nr:alpha/beta fold hydrolase [Undibacterium flavidum]